MKFDTEFRTCFTSFYTYLHILYTFFTFLYTFVHFIKFVEIRKNLQFSTLNPLKPKCPIFSTNFHAVILILSAPKKNFRPTLSDVKFYALSEYGLRICLKSLLKKL